jgi:site-specific DNA-methyltransferase (adenine-specific)
VIRLLNGDALAMLRTLPSESVHCVVTSPPYFGLRDYGVAGQIGLEDTPDAFVAEMVAVFREVRRVLRDDGTLWLNLGDTANNRRRIRSTSHQPSLNGFEEMTWAEATKAGLTRLSLTSNGLKEKDMFGIPWHTATALRADGWYLRQEIIWAKNFGKPEPSVDRLPNRHEQIFLLSKAKNYHFDRAALPHYANGSVWDVPPTGRSDHGAAFAEGLVEPCILAGCPAGGTVLDPFGGAGTTGLVAQELGRNAILIELSEAYCGVIRKRLNLLPAEIEEALAL